jgi:hypothetical protein
MGKGEEGLGQVTMTMCVWEMVLKYAPPIVTVFIAAGVAYIAFRQYRTAKEKLRLDLYNRRFDIYSTTLSLYNELIVWEGTKEQKALQMPFIKAFRESQFLFSRDVYEVLERFQKNAFVIIMFENVKPMLSSLGEEGMKQVEKRTNAVNEISISLPEIELRMAPFLDFHKI